MLNKNKSSRTNSHRNFEISIAVWYQHNFSATRQTLGQHTLLQAQTKIGLNPVMQIANRKLLFSLSIGCLPNSLSSKYRDPPQKMCL